MTVLPYCTPCLLWYLFRTVLSVATETTWARVLARVYQGLGTRVQGLARV